MSHVNCLFNTNLTDKFSLMLRHVSFSRFDQYIDYLSVDDGNLRDVLVATQFSNVLSSV